MQIKSNHSKYSLTIKPNNMTYLGVVYKKEGVHWKRMWTMLKRFKGFTKIIGAIGLIILSIVHLSLIHI